MSFLDKVKSTTAKSYEKIARRIRVQENPETVELLKDDALNNMQRELKREGHTGKLGTSDGLTRIKPFVYRGFLITIYGYPSGEWKCLCGEILPKHGIVGSEKIFDLDMQPTEKQAGRLAIMAVNAYRGGKP